MLMNNAVYGETMEKVIKDNKLAITERRKYYLLLESNYHTTNLFRENLLAKEMKNFNTAVQ